MPILSFQIPPWYCEDKCGNQQYSMKLITGKVMKECGDINTTSLSAVLAAISCANQSFQSFPHKADMKRTSPPQIPGRK